MNNDILETINLLATVEEQLLDEYGRKPTLDEIAEEMQIDIEVVHSVMKMNKRITTLMDSIKISIDTAQFISDQIDKSVDPNERNAMNHRLHMELDEHDKLQLELKNLTN